MATNEVGIMKNKMFDNGDWEILDDHELPMIYSHCSTSVIATSELLEVRRRIEKMDPTSKCCKYTINKILDTIDTQMGYWFKPIGTMRCPKCGSERTVKIGGDKFIDSEFLCNDCTTEFKVKPKAPEEKWDIEIQYDGLEGEKDEYPSVELNENE